MKTTTVYVMKESRDTDRSRSRGRKVEEEKEADQEETVRVLYERWDIGQRNASTGERTDSLKDVRQVKGKNSFSMQLS